MKLFLIAFQLIFHSCNHLLPELSLLGHALFGGTIPVLNPRLQLTSLVLNEVFVGFNLRKALSITLQLWKSNTFGLQQILAKLNCHLAQLSLALLTNLANTLPR